MQVKTHTSPNSSSQYGLNLQLNGTSKKARISIYNVRKGETTPSDVKMSSKFLPSSYYKNTIILYIKYIKILHTIKTVSSRNYF